MSIVRTRQTIKILLAWSSGPCSGVLEGLSGVPCLSGIHLVASQWKQNVSVMTFLSSLSSLVVCLFLLTSYFNYFVILCMYASMCPWVQVPTEDQSFRSPEAGIAGGCELHYMDARSRTWILDKNSTCSLLRISLYLLFCFVVKSNRGMSILFL